jgi:hypothetical protein
VTKKPPKLTLIAPEQPGANPLAAPPSLGEAGRKLWQAIHNDYIIEDSGGREMLLRICEAADSLAQYDEEIGRDGVMIRVRGTLREHPLLKHRLATQSFVVRSLLRLGLDIEPVRHGEIGRPGAYDR